MDKDILELTQTIVSVIGIPTLLISLIFVFRQTREMTKQTKINERTARASVYQNIPTLMIQIDRFFIENPDIKKYFYNNKKIKERDPNYEKTLSVAEMILDFMEYVITISPSLPEYPWECWSSYFKRIIVSSPIIRKFWSDNKQWYPVELQNKIDTEFQKATKIQQKKT